MAAHRDGVAPAGSRAARRGTLLVHGKGRRERIAYIGANGGRAALEAWLQLRGAGAGPLFAPVSKAGAVAAGRPLTGQAIAKRIRRRADQAELGLVTPHMLRGSFATHLLAAGNDLAVVADCIVNRHGKCPGYRH